MKLKLETKNLKSASDPPSLSVTPVHENIRDAESPTNQAKPNADHLQTIKKESQNNLDIDKPILKLDSKKIMPDKVNGAFENYCFKEFEAEGKTEGTEEIKVKYKGD